MTKTECRHERQVTISSHKICCDCNAAFPILEQPNPPKRPSEIIEERAKQLGIEFDDKMREIGLNAVLYTPDFKQDAILEYLDTLAGF